MAIDIRSQTLQQLVVAHRLILASTQGSRRDLNGKAQDMTAKEALAEVVTQVETEITIKYRELKPVHGLVLVVQNQHQAETDRYLLDFVDGATFRITNKWTGQSTTIWGDPHIDTSDQEGNCNGEFSDLKTSNTHTTPRSAAC